MARGRAASFGAGHNSEALSDDDKSALHLHYSLRIRAQEAEAAEAKAAYDAKKSAVSGTFKLVANDLKITRKDFQRDLELVDLNEAEFRRHENERRWRLGNLGCAVGEQMALPLGDIVDDQEFAYADGFRAGRRADDAKPPEKIATYLHPKWMEGWHEGQLANAPMLKRALELIAEREAAGADGDGDGGDEDEGADAAAGVDEDDDFFDPAAEARKLEQGGFLETSGGEDDDSAPGLSDVFPGDEAAKVADLKVERRRRRSEGTQVH